jgi:hypothetical protein
LRIGQFKNNPLPAPTGHLELHLDGNSMRDLWIVLTWES